MSRAKREGTRPSFPGLPGCISEGESLEETLAHIREAIELYLEPIDDDLGSKDGTLDRELLIY